LIKLSARLRLAASIPAVMVVVGAVLRPLLYVSFHDGPFSIGQLGLALAAGVVLDALVGVVVAAPVALALALFRFRWLERSAARFVLLASTGAVATFFAVVEFYFFQEFNSRFNNIAVDYIRNPSEVLGNIHESYQLGLVATCSIAAGLALGLIGMKATRGFDAGSLSWAKRFRGAGATLAIVGLAAAGLAYAPVDVSHDRIVNEVARRTSNTRCTTAPFRTASRGAAPRSCWMPRGWGRIPRKYRRPTPRWRNPGTSWSSSKRASAASSSACSATLSARRRRGSTAGAGKGCC
jgi:hypothetical protein